MSQNFYTKLSTEIPALFLFALFAVVASLHSVDGPRLLGQAGNCEAGYDGCACKVDDYGGGELYKWCNNGECINDICHDVTCEYRNSGQEYPNGGYGYYCYTGFYEWDELGNTVPNDSLDAVTNMEPPEGYTLCDTGITNGVFSCSPGTYCRTRQHDEENNPYFGSCNTEGNSSVDWGGDVIVWKNCTEPPADKCQYDDGYGTDLQYCETHLYWCEKCPNGVCPDDTPAPTDNCPNDPDKTEPGVCGCGTADTDSDGDGTPDCNDQCSDDADKTNPGICGCGQADVDSDNDGAYDCDDKCPNDPNKSDSTGFCGCGVEDIDVDGDGISDCNQCEPTEEYCLAPSGNTAYCCASPKVCASQDIQDAANDRGIDISDSDSSEYIMCSYACSTDQDCIDKENQYGDILRTDRDEGCYEPFCNDLGFCRKRLACESGEHCYEKSEGIFACLPCDDSVLDSCLEDCEAQAKAERNECYNKWFTSDPDDLDQLEICLDVAKDNFRICIEECADESFCDSGGYVPPPFPSDPPPQCQNSEGCVKEYCLGNVDFCYNGDQCTQPWCNFTTSECEYIPWQVPIDGCTDTTGGSNGNGGDDDTSRTVRRTNTSTSSQSSGFNFSINSFSVSSGVSESSSDSTDSTSSADSVSSSASSQSFSATSSDGMHMACINNTCTQVLAAGEDQCSTDEDCLNLSSFSSDASLSFSFGFSSLDLSTVSSASAIAFSSVSIPPTDGSSSSSSSSQIIAFDPSSFSSTSNLSAQVPSTSSSEYSVGVPTISTASSALSLRLSFASTSDNQDPDNDDDGDGDNDDGIPDNDDSADEDDDGDGVDDDGIPDNDDSVNTYEDDDGNGVDDDGIADNDDTGAQDDIDDDDDDDGIRNTLVAAAALCGNGLLEVGEECDDSNRRNNDGCSAECLLEVGICGDGIVQKLLGEQCEQATFDTSLPYSCVRCRFVSSACGDGAVDPGEECDDGTSNSTSPDATCRPDCSFGRCGDGVLDSAELCDDGNRLSGDGCDRYCRNESTQIAGESFGTSSAPTQVQSQDLLAQYQFPFNPSGQVLPYQLPLAQLQPLVQGQAPIGDTGPAAVAVIGAGAAAGWSWMKRRK